MRRTEITNEYLQEIVDRVKPFDYTPWTIALAEELLETRRELDAKQKLLDVRWEEKLDLLKMLRRAQNTVQELSNAGPRLSRCGIKLNLPAEFDGEAYCDRVPDHHGHCSPRECSWLVLA